MAPPRRRPLRILGVLNVTPDSFSDGGRFLDPVRAVEHGLLLESEGADVLDVGGESTRPGSRPVPASEELARVLPVIAGLAKRSRAALSIDTTKSEVARAALDAGATIVNDVSAGRFDPPILALAAERGATLVLMHMLGTPRDMQDDPRYDDVVTEVRAFLRERAAAAERAGASPRTDLDRPGDRVREDARAQPGAPGAPARDRRPRAPGLPGGLAEIVRRQGRVRRGTPREPVRRPDRRERGGGRARSAGRSLDPARARRRDHGAGGPRRARRRGNARSPGLRACPASIRAENQPARAT
jgi:hypothetical protein